METIKVIELLNILAEEEYPMVDYDRQYFAKETLKYINELKNMRLKAIHKLISCGEMMEASLQNDLLDILKFDEEKELSKYKEANKKAIEYCNEKIPHAIKKL